MTEAGNNEIKACENVNLNQNSKKNETKLTKMSSGPGFTYPTGDR